MAHRPSRVRTQADQATLAWLNTLLGTIWPHANTAVQQKLETEVVPKLREVPALKNFKFERFHLGSELPKIGPIAVHKVMDGEGKESLEIELAVHYDSDLDILVDIGIVKIGVKGLALHGNMHIVLAPLLDVLPLMGCAQVFFASCPTMKFKFEGIAAVPGLEDALIGTITDVLEKKMVLPNRHIVPICKDFSLYDAAEASITPPKGVMCVQVLSAKHLPGANWKYGDVEQFSSNPFPVYKTGGEPLSGVVQKDTTDPTWTVNHKDNTAWFVVHNLEQGFNIEMRAEDTSTTMMKVLGQGNHVGMLGETGQIRIKDIDEGNMWVNSGENPNPAEAFAYRTKIYLDAKKVYKQMLHANDPILHGVKSLAEVRAQWMHISSKPSARASETALLFLRIHQAKRVNEILLMEGISIRGTIMGRGQTEKPVTLLSQPVKTKPGQHIDSSMADAKRLEECGGIVGYSAATVDRMMERRLQPHDISYFLDIPEENIRKYIAWKNREDTMMTTKSGSAFNLQDLENSEHVDAQWNEIHSFFIPRNELPDSELYLDFTLGKKTDKMGQIVIPLSDLLLSQQAEGTRISMHELPRQTYRVSAPRGADKKGGGISSFFFPSCNAPSSPTSKKKRAEIEKIELELTLDLKYRVLETVFDPVAKRNTSDNLDAMMYVFQSLSLLNIPINIVSVSVFCSVFGVLSWSILAK